MSLEKLQSHFQDFGTPANHYKSHYPHMEKAWKT